MTIQQTISQLANQCVLCGLCIPHCPTYMIFRTENESPRGRISLFKALAEEQFAADFKSGEALIALKTSITSLDHCLTCRACEKICPSQVDYATINKLGRELIATQYPLYQRPLKQKLAEKLLLTPSLHPLLKLSAKATAPFQSFFKNQSGNESVFALIAGFSHEITEDSSSSAPLQDYYPATEGFFSVEDYLLAEGSSPAEDSLSVEDSSPSAQKPKVILFKGCSGDLLEQQTLIAAITLLNACQFDVYVPDKQQCCGAINARQGDAHGMKALAKQNISQFASLLQKSQAIISINNSCSAHLKEYNQLTDGSEEFSHKVTDIVSFLAQALKTAHVKFAPLPQIKESQIKESQTQGVQEIGVHIPCSLKNVLKEDSVLFDLLRNIPDIQLININDQYCCGAAGSYMLQYPDIANRLLDDKIDDIMHQHYQTIVSSNIGCSLHFKQGLKKHENKIGRTVEVLHPVRLLARQLVKPSQSA